MSRRKTMKVIGEGRLEEIKEHFAYCFDHGLTIAEQEDRLLEELYEQAEQARRFRGMFVTSESLRGEQIFQKDLAHFRNEEYYEVLKYYADVDNYDTYTDADENGLTVEAEISNDLGAKAQDVLNMETEDFKNTVAKYRKYREALEFYASDISWQPDLTGYSDIDKFGKEPAVEALKEEK